MVYRTWKEWKATYTKANRKDIVKRMVADNVEQFGGAAPAGAAVGAPNPLQVAHNQ